MMTTEEIAQLAEIMSENELTEISLQTDTFQLKLLRGSREIVTAVSPAAFAPVPVVAASAPVSSPACPEADAPVSIKSPIVGTFYAAPAPDAPPFVSVGDRVTPDTVVCIVEAMKVMNEIKAEKSGIIKRVLVDNASPVEFGQPLFAIETD